MSRLAVSVMLEIGREQVYAKQAMRSGGSRGRLVKEAMQ
jgi:hypothetical protein